MDSIILVGEVATDNQCVKRCRDISHISSIKTHELARYINKERELRL